MLNAVDHTRRDSTLLQFTTKRLRDLIDPNHMLIQMDERFDFAKLVAPLEDRYCSDNGRPAIHPEVLIRALLICSLYNVASFRRLCSALSENIAFRWFCFLTIDDPVFDHSTISHFIERIGRDGSGKIIHSFNEELLRLDLVSQQMYADSSLVKANVCDRGLARSGMTGDVFKDRAVEENGLFVLRESSADESSADGEKVRYFQDPKGRIPLNPVDTDARWRTVTRGKLRGLSYQENVIVDRGGFILGRKVTHSSEGEWKAVNQMLDQLPIQPTTLAADTFYSTGTLRSHLDVLGITAYIPIHPNHKANLVAGGGFVYKGDHLLCPEGKQMPIGAFLKRDSAYQYVARQQDCQRCRHQGRVPAAPSETAIRDLEHVSRRVLESCAAQPELGLRSGDEGTSDHRQGHVRLP